MRTGRETECKSGRGKRWRVRGRKEAIANGNQGARFRSGAKAKAFRSPLRAENGEKEREVEGQGC